MGKVIEVETSVQGVGNFVRIRVKLDVRKVLARIVTLLRGGKREIYHKKYEKIPRFCGACGFLGHSHLECGTGEHDESKLKWGSWLKADWETWKGRNPGGFGGGFSAGRGRDPSGGRSRMPAGRGEAPVSWRFNALAMQKPTEPVDEELKDTATSPLKPQDSDMIDKEATEVGAKKRLLLAQDQHVEVQVQDDTLVNLAITTMDTGVNLTPAVGDDTENSNTRIKRTKKAGADSPSLGSAGSREEPVRSQ